MILRMTLENVNQSIWQAVDNQAVGNISFILWQISTNTTFWREDCQILQIQKRLERCKRA